MRAIAVVEPGRVELVELPMPIPGPYQALVKTEVACLCNATDAKIVAGHFPGIKDYPAVLGHESAGIVQEVGDKVRGFHVGDRVIGGLVFEFADKKYSSAWGGFCEYTLVTDHDAMVADGVADAEHGWFEVYQIQRTVPRDITVEAAALLCTWREVYGGFGDFRLKAGDDILVFGAGPVGLSFVKFGRLLGLGFIGAVDPLAEKHPIALAMGANTALPPDHSRLRDLVRQRGKPFDAIIDAVGSNAIINAALPLITSGGSVCVYGVIDKPAIDVEKAAGPYNFNLLIHQWPTRTLEAAAQEPICQWLRQGRLNANDFISVEYPLDRINDALQFASSGRALKILLRYENNT